MNSTVNLMLLSCRLCLTQSKKLLSINKENLQDKINTYLPIKVKFSLNSVSNKFFADYFKLFVDNK